MLIIARNDLYKINFGYISIGSNESNVLIRRLFLDRELCIIKANTCQYLSARGKICGHVSIERSFFISLCEMFLYSVDNLTFLVSCSPLSIRVSVREKVYGGSLSVAPNSMAGRP